MLSSRHIDKICIGAALLAVIIMLILAGGENLGILKASANAGYTYRLFDDSCVHTIELELGDWEGFLRNAAAEEYVLCDVTIDGEEFRQVGVRTKGNNSLQLTEEYGLSRYSLKIEFDHFTDGGNYYGLDKFSLDASFQDNSYLKTYMAYDMMSYMDVPAPLCSYVWLQVNGQDWGLFLAVEEPEEAFAVRNFGRDHGKLYKPDYRSLDDANDDIALKYIDDNPDSYPGIFENAKFKTSAADEQRLIEALRILASGENLEQAVNVDEVLRYFAVQVFVMNWDSYLGYTGHNYFLYEENGRLSMLPWDYNLAFGTYALGMPEPIKDPGIIINYPIDTPAEGWAMLNRPLYHVLMQDDRHFARYHEYFDEFVGGYFEEGYFAEKLQKTAALIAPYVEKDPTAFCSYQDHKAAVEMFAKICLLRAQSVRAQLEGKQPATLSEQAAAIEAGTYKGVDVSGVDLAVLGDFDDLESAAR